MKARLVGSRAGCAAVVLLLASVLAACGRKEETAEPTAVLEAPTLAAQGDTSGISPALCWRPEQQTADLVAGKPQWTSPPAIVVDPAKQYTATLTTSKGAFTVEFFPSEAPQTVSNFLCLASSGYYNGVPFHRIIRGFMVQTGDPLGTGGGGPGYRFADELPQGRTYNRGTLAMANAGVDTNGSQFFVCLADGCNGLPPSYSIFGTVIAGMEVVDAIAETPVGPNPSNPSEQSDPLEPVSLDSVTINVV